MVFLCRIEVLQITFKGMNAIKNWDMPRLYTPIIVICGFFRI